MIVYLSTIIIILMLGFIYSNIEAKTQQSYRRQYIIVISILLILQSGLRNVAVGADTYQYLQIFERVKWLSWSDIYDIFMETYHFGEGKDPGYLAIQKLVQYLLPDYQLFLILIAIIFFSALGNFIHKNTTSISEAVFAYVIYSCLFFSFFSITGHRQTIATAAALYGFELIKKRKLVLFLLLILIASSIHKSALIVLPFYFIATLKKTTFFYIVALLLFPFLMVYKMEFYQLLQDWSGYRINSIYERVGTYTFTFMMFLVAAVAFWRMKTVIRQNEAARKVYNAFILALILTPLTWVDPSAMRAVQYYSIFMLVLVPEVINSFQRKSPRLHAAVYLLAIIVLLALFINANINREYAFFWQATELGEN